MCTNFLNHYEKGRQELLKDKSIDIVTTGVITKYMINFEQYEKD